MSYIEVRSLTKYIIPHSLNISIKQVIRVNIFISLFHIFQLDSKTFIIYLLKKTIHLILKKIFCK